jgi:hypothetical protein
MNERLPLSGRVHTPVRSVLGLLPVCLVLAAGLLLAGCGGGSSDSVGTTTSAGAGEAVSTTAQAASMSPSELGDAIGATWAEAMQKLTALLGSKPEAGAIKGQVEQLKEEYIGKLVELGTKREALSTGDKAQVGLRTVAALEGAADAPWYVSYNTIYGYYSSGDQDFANLLASFNILTQYAEFDLLKQQAPEEAARLGIK